MTYGQSATEEAIEAQMMAFDLALDDVPAWAVESAARGWLRAESLPDGANPAFMPRPPQLRIMAERHVAAVRAKIYRIDKVLGAREVEPPSEEERERGRKLMAELVEALKPKEAEENAASE